MNKGQKPLDLQISKLRKSKNRNKTPKKRHFGLNLRDLFVARVEMNLKKLTSYLLLLAKTTSFIFKKSKNNLYLNTTNN